MNKKPNQRAVVKNPNNLAYKAANDNRSKLMNPNQNSKKNESASKNKK